MATRYKTLSSQSAELVKHFTDLSQSAFTLREAVNLFSRSSRDAVKKLTRDMVLRGLLLRLKDGVYWIIPYNENALTYFPDPHLVAKYITNDTSFYIGYYSALELHSLITQPSFREQIVVNKQVKPSLLKIREHKFQFIYHNTGHFFGVKNIWIDSFNKVSCSDLEKTFVDCLYKPDYAGGIAEIAKAMFKSKDNIDYEKLLDYCSKFSAQSVIKRLGFLLELLDIHNPILDRLQQLKSVSLILLEPSYEKKGPTNNKWSIQQNVEISDITSSIFS